MTRVVQALGLRATVDVEETDAELRATVNGDDLGLLIGKHGATIDALQHLAMRAALRGAETRKQVTVDAAGYRDRRAQALHRAADRAVADALRYGRAVELEPMRALERKVVHTYLSDRTDIETHSEGDEPDRRLVVTPLRPSGILSVSRETLERLAWRYGVPSSSVGALDALLDALEAEPDPPTTVRTGSAALDVHIADSLSGLEVEALARARRIADIGSGAGFPGLVLAAALPDAQVDLIEAAARKCAVIERLAAAAGLANARALAVRAEDSAEGEAAGSYDAVTARAVAPLAVLAEYAAPLLTLGGTLVCWKGRREPDEERAGAAAAEALALEPQEVVRVRPFDEARERHLHPFVKVGPTPAGIPRRPGMARKRPLA